MTETGKSNTLPSVVSYDDVRAVSPVLEHIAHLAFYSGWANAMSAVAVAKDIFINAELESINFRPRRTD